MPRLPKFKDVHISPLTGPMNSSTPLDLLSEKQFRYIKNFRVDGAGRLKRAGGLKPLFDDGNYNVGAAIKNNSDLHDQLGSKQSPSNSIREHITMLYEFESGGGSRKLIAATKSRVYALNQRSRNWVLIGDNGGAGYGEGTSADYSTTKFRASQLGNNIVFTNNYDEPLYWYFDSTPDLVNKNLLQTIPDLVKLKITKVNYIAEYKGFMFLADLEENTTQQIAKVQWSDYVDATSYYPSTASLSGQQTVGDIGEAIIGMAVLGDHLMIYKERSIWRCSLVSSANLFVFKQIYQGENTPFYTDTLINVGDSHFYMSEAGVYRISISDIRPVRVDWVHNASAIIYNKEMISAEDATGPRHVTGGIKSVAIPQSGVVAQVSGCSDSPPVISAHPGNLTVNCNPCSTASYTGSATLSVATSSGKEPFNYQWQVSLVSGLIANCTTVSGSKTIISDGVFGYQLGIATGNNNWSGSYNSHGIQAHSNLVVGGPVTGVGIPSNTVIESIVDSITFTISKAASVTGNNNLTFAAGFVDIPNQNSSSYIIDKPTVVDVSNKKFRVNVSNDDLPAGVNSNESTVTLASSTPSFTLIPPRENDAGSPESSVVSSGDTVYVEARWCTGITSFNWESKPAGLTFFGETVFGNNQVPIIITGTPTSGGTAVTTASTANVAKGQAVSGTGIPASTFVTIINSSTQFTISNNATAGNSTSITLTPIYNGSSVSRQDGMVAPSNPHAGYYYSRLIITNIQSGVSGVANKLSITNASGTASTVYSASIFSTVNGSNVVRHTSNATSIIRDLYVGKPVTGSGIPAGTIVSAVTNITNPKSFRISKDATATANNVSLTFGEAVITVVASASSSVDGGSGNKTITAGGSLVINQVGSDYRVALTKETIGYYVKRSGGKLLPAADGRSLAQNKRDGKTLQIDPLTVRAIGGTPDYKFLWYRNYDSAGVIINETNASSLAVGTTKTVTVKELPTNLKAGQVIEFVNSDLADPTESVFTLTSDANAGTTQIVGNITEANLSNGLESYSFWDSGSQVLISEHEDATCDFQSFQESCNILINTQQITCVNAGDSDGSTNGILEGMTVSGDGIPEGTIITSVIDPDSHAENTADPKSSEPPYSGTASPGLRINLSNEVTKSQLTNVTFIKKTISCNSNANIRVGDRIEHAGIPKGSVVESITGGSAGSVTEFKISEFPTITGVDNLIKFTPPIANSYYQNQETTKYENDTSKLSFIISDESSSTDETVGFEHQYKCFVYDAASGSFESDSFNIQLFTKINS